MRVAGIPKVVDKREAIIQYLDILKQKAFAENEPFKVRAYGKVISALKRHGEIYSVADVENIPGIGEKIRSKIAEILETGTLAEAVAAAESLPVAAYEELLQVHGIGPAKARELIKEHGIRSVAELRKAVEENPALLNDTQKKALKYYNDIIKRIPRKEMTLHEEYIRTLLLPIFQMVVVGSYRRGLPNSGDVDVMLTLPREIGHAEQVRQFQKSMSQMLENGYMVDYFAWGEHKMLAMAKLPRHKTVRRVDFLLCPPDEYWYTILYFTGSDTFNVSMRQWAIKQGYSLSEHGLKPLRTGLPKPPVMECEEDIFKFLGLKYVPPNLRNSVL